jgi:phosphotransferase system enzyme I (PtsI)
MPAPVELTGRPASPGMAVGPLFRLDAEIARRLPTGDVTCEGASLRSAVTMSIGQIERLMAKADPQSGAILEFQTAMLADDELIVPALARIESGDSAEAAWLAALAEQITGYETSDDDYFRARAGDLMDLRDRVLRNLSGVDLQPPPPGAIVTGNDVTPTRFLEADWSKGGGVALTDGSARSHVAMLARSQGVPMVVGLGALDLDGHSEALIDGETGLVVLSPGRAERLRFDERNAAHVAAAERAARYLHGAALTADGTPIQVLINVAKPDDVERVDAKTCDGVGLMRTEFLFTGPTLPDEETQYRAYARVLEWAGEKPVTIRTVDAGGDKPVRGLTIEEPNPFLGLRGIRLSLARRDIFKVQLRALAHAAPRGNLKVMLPMVTVPSELAAAEQLLDEALGELAGEKIPAAKPPLGIMVEVPAAALVPETLAKAAFFSIGSNDLTQYVMAAARDSTHVADLNDVTHPAVLQLIAGVARYGARTGMDVSLCGDAASEPAHLRLLLAAGLRSLSVAPAALARVKAAIAEVRIRGADGN